MSGFTETYLLDCNRRLSAEFRADPNNDSKNVFTYFFVDGHTPQREIDRKIGR